MLNLESMGAGGPHRLFQARTDTRAGVEALRAWARVVPRASGNVFAEDIFNSGLINSGTDYAIFREFGDRETALFDFAYVERTSVYHTPRDRVKYVRPGSMRQSGENLLEFMSLSSVRADSALTPTRRTRRLRPCRGTQFPDTAWSCTTRLARSVTRRSSRSRWCSWRCFCARRLGRRDFRVGVRARTQAVTRARMEDTFRLMVAIPTVIIGCACGWIAAITGAAIAPAMVARAFANPTRLRRASRRTRRALGRRRVRMFRRRADCRALLSFALLPLSVKMRSTDDAERVAQWSSLSRNVVVWAR